MWVYVVLIVVTCFEIVKTNEKEIQDKVIVITGGAQGIGYAIADNFLANGASTVIILDKDYTKGVEAEEKLINKYSNSKVLFIECDITTDSLIWDNIVQNFKHIDVFINNAGIVDEDNPRNTITTNTVALIEWSLRFLEHARSDMGGRGGTIINVASVTGYWVAPFTPTYISSKYGVIGFSKSLGHAHNYKTTGVRVVVICPSFTHTTVHIDPDKRVDAFDDFMRSQPWQTADEVGARTVEVFKNADSGTSWDIIGGDPPVQSPSVRYIEISDKVTPEVKRERSGKSEL